MVSLPHIPDLYTYYTNNEPALAGTHTTTCNYLKSEEYTKDGIRNQSRLRHNHNRPAPPRPPHSPTASSPEGTSPTPTLNPNEPTHSNKNCIDSPRRRLRPRLLHNNNPNNPDLHNQEPQNLHRQPTHRYLVGCGNQPGRMSPIQLPLLTFTPS